MTLDETQCLGCVYLEPSRKSSFDVVVSMWVRVSELGNGLDSDLYGAVRKWISEFWPFTRPAYPGREISTEQWKQIPNDL